MRHVTPARLAIFLAVFLGSVPAPAQVSTDDAALKALQPAATATPSAPPKPAAAQPPAPTAGRAPAHKSTPKPGTKPAAIALPSLPAAAPANPVIAPPPPVLPAHKRTLPPPVPVKPDAVGSAVTLEGGATRLTFGAGSADMNPALHAAVRSIAERALADRTLAVTITAFAPGKAEDPSSPRRLSLDRALAVRAILIQAGVPSERILAVARGFAGIEAGPPDRVDIVAAPPRAAPAPTSPAARAPTSPAAPAPTSPAAPAQPAPVTVNPAPRAAPAQPGSQG